MIFRIGWWMQGWFRWRWLPTRIWYWNARIGPYRLGAVLCDWTTNRRTG